MSSLKESKDYIQLQRNKAYNQRREEAENNAKAMIAYEKIIRMYSPEVLARLKDLL